MNQTLKPGTIVAEHFLIEQLLAEKANSATYAASAGDQRVLVKVLASEMLAQPALVERWRQKAEAARLLADARNVRVIDYGVDTKLAVPFVVTEWIDGRSLREHVKLRGRLEPLAARSLLFQIATALERAHAHGLAHGALTPDNVLVTDNDFVKVVDFSLAEAALAMNVDMPAESISGWIPPADAAFPHPSARTSGPSG